jgi:hypothetical protein
MNNASVERDGKHYCGIHDPERLKLKRAATARKYQLRAEADAAARNRESDCREACRCLSNPKEQVAALLHLAKRVASLNRATRENGASIGDGMLNGLIDEAKAALKDI